MGRKRIIKNRSKKKFIYLICNKCKKKQRIRTNDESIYTDEVRAKYICLLCKYKKGE